MSDRKIIIGLILLQLLLCLPVIGLFPISLDEPFSIYHAQYPLGEMLTEVAQGNNSPLHFIGLHYWIQLFGISPLGVRSLSVVISLISIIYLYKLGRKFWKKEYAVILVLLFMISRINHFVAMEARMYGVFALFFILILYDVYRLIFEDKRVYINLGIWNALILYTHYLGGVVIFMEAIVFLSFYSNWNRNKWFQVSLTALIAIVLFIPGIQIFLNRASDFNSSGTWVPDAQFYDLIANLIKLLNNRFTLFATLGILLTIGYLYRRNKKPKKINYLSFFALWFFGTYLLMFIISLTVQPIFFIKYLQFLTVPLFLFIIGFVAQFEFVGKQKYIPFVLLIPFMASYRFVPDVNRETDVLIDYIEEKKDSNTVIFYCPAHYELTLAYHINTVHFQDYEQTSNHIKDAGYFSIYQPSDITPANSIKKLIYLDLDAKTLNPNNDIVPYLDESYEFIESKTFKGDFKVYRYQIK